MVSVYKMYCDDASQHARMFHAVPVACHHMHTDSYTYACGY